MAFQGIAVIWLPIGGTFVLDPLTSVLFTVLIVLVSINAINFVDGTRRPCGRHRRGGRRRLLRLRLPAARWQFGVERATLATLVSVLLVGICLGLLPHNAEQGPHVFMGDTGSMMLGLLLAAATITLSGQIDPSAVAGHHPAARRAADPAPGRP
jgi:UDP-GlcNAc:undecaprenyl-phosphate GlcNAc-1-phosphate transferase